MWKADRILEEWGVFNQIEVVIRSNIIRIRDAKETENLSKEDD